MVTNPNLLYIDYHMAMGDRYDIRRPYSVGNVEFVGYREEALEFFRNHFPSHSLMFRNKGK